MALNAISALGDGFSHPIGIRLKVLCPTMGKKRIVSTHSALPAPDLKSQLSFRERSSGIDSKAGHLLEFLQNLIRRYAALEE